MLVETCCLPERAVLAHGNRYRAAARPVRRGRHRTCFIEIEMTWHHTLGGGPVQFLQLTGFAIDGKSGHVAGGGFAVVSAQLVYGVEKASPWMHGEVARTLGLGSQLG